MSDTLNPTESAQIKRVLSNNAVLVTVGTIPQVLVAKGVGFQAKSGDIITFSAQHQRFVHLSPEQAQFFESLNAIDTEFIEHFSQALDLATDILGPLHPSVYVLLVEHLVFALERAQRDELLSNGITGEIRAVFPLEYSAAEVMLQYINSQLDGTPLPKSEAGFIALHLNAALSGTSVRNSLAAANELASYLRFIREGLNLSAYDLDHFDSGLEPTIARLIRRLRGGIVRSNAAQPVIAQQLHTEYSLARQLICRILGSPDFPPTAGGEAAYLAVFLHGLMQDHHMSAPQL
ncbi:PRD domain-containing protein [Corynebacterium sp. ES2794-CONJ1]|uniref:PRD domain-containing protein n=1 Tax=unclassified Corynebacterium TaxID=2624378 RepID=UPI0021671CC9|nr:MULTISPECIES: PRD domain-containing protein [unclassified Corynebacterium]MCS4490271.1 PRD domain-containing protein [Corynebacterium sp. ES2775-CONJ]MCS4491918.1 PRD domain-containing protein [Corynebacterium sp. ES2715-CONJ3]MCS4532023.1 PRD domain-containing protein [Corynebacterium sp. ES2730-CONJ]MCU9519424.1 PRD domain-containing protein [Corynebacterium sp. ES2794-CONJ1]